MASRLATLVLAALALLGITGCASSNEGAGESDLPQAQPASWEGGLPGMTPGGPAR